MRTAFFSRSVLGALLLTVLGSDPAHAAEATATPTWIYPVIEGYGRVRPNEALPVRPDPKTDYRVLIDVLHFPDNPAKVGDPLQRLARLVNLLGYAGVPPEKRHIVAVLDERGGLYALSHAAYHRMFNVDNPNVELLQRLKAAGVQLLVCSQALAEAGLQASDVLPETTVTLSALTDVTIYGQQGYSYLQL
jgi:intracellular sulfur oxidation DsrE/DsrF family protein